jgi:hypothetical protein
MHAMGEIKPANRFTSTPLGDGQFAVLDRINGSKVGDQTYDADGVKAEYERLNQKGAELFPNA